MYTKYVNPKYQWIDERLVVTYWGIHVLSRRITVSYFQILLSPAKPAGQHKTFCDSQYMIGAYHRKKISLIYKQCEI
jgi:hypothetical protein